MHQCVRPLHTCHMITCILGVSDDISVLSGIKTSRNEIMGFCHQLSSEQKTQCYLTIFNNNIYMSIMFLSYLAYISTVTHNFSLSLSSKSFFYIYHMI